MSGENWLVLLPTEAMEVIDKSYAWGNLTCRLSAPDKAAIVVALSNEDSDLVHLTEDPDHFLTVADFNRVGHWYRVPADAAFSAYLLTHQHATMPFDAFQTLVPQAIAPLPGQWHIAVTFCPDPPEIRDGERLPAWSAWTISNDTVRPISLDIQDGTQHVTALGSLWPTSLLSTSRALLLGAGSIGGAAAEALASYGVGHIDLVDPDKILFHNVPRHVLAAASVGMSKVDGLKASLNRQWPESNISPWPIDLTANANITRPLIDAADIIICTVDGVEPRRVANYLARRAGKPIVFACVLADGRYGEILRIRALPEVGCLDCQRRYMRDNGMIDPEPSLDRGYGDGTRHNPMTAIGGDLHLVGSIAAKVAVATLLQNAGEVDQTLTDDNLVIALRPSPGYAAPFDARRALHPHWSSATPPYPDCPACHRHP